MPYPAAQQYPTGQYPAPPYQPGAFPAAPYQDPLTLGTYGRDAVYPGQDPLAAPGGTQQARYQQPPADAPMFPEPAGPAEGYYAPYYQPPPTDVASGGFAPTDTSAIPITAFRESLAARPAQRPAAARTATGPAQRRRAAKPATAGSTPAGALPAVTEKAGAEKKAGVPARPPKRGVRRARLRRRRQLAAIAGVGVLIVAIATAFVLRVVDGGDSSGAVAAPTFAVSRVPGVAKTYPFPVFALSRQGENPDGQDGASAAPSMSPGGALGGAFGSAASGNLPSGIPQLVLTPVAQAPGAPGAAHT